MERLQICCLNRQNGSTLVMTMVILVILMLIGVAAMVTSDTQFKLAGNLQFENTALNNSESALAVAESWLATGNNYNEGGFATYNSTGNKHLYPIGYLAGLTAPNNDPLTMTWNDDNSLEVNSTQRYLIEQLATNRKLLGSSQAVGGHGSAGCNQVNVYRITTRGTSARGATKFTQSIYSVLSCS